MQSIIHHLQRVQELKQQPARGLMSPFHVFHSLFFRFLRGAEYLPEPSSLCMLHILIFDGFHFIPWQPDIQAVCIQDWDMATVLFSVVFTILLYYLTWLRIRMMLDVERGTLRGLSACLHVIVCEVKE